MRKGNAHVTLSRMPKLTIKLLCEVARHFSAEESRHAEKALYGVTDGKAVGTYLEQKFRKCLQDKGYAFQAGNSGSGIDFPDLQVDMKVTSIRQPQSSCPYKEARQKIYGLGYSLIVFVYRKVDDRKRKTGTLDILHTVFVEAKRTGDFQVTRDLRHIVDNEGNAADIAAYISDKNLPLDSIALEKLSKEVLKNRPEQGYLNIPEPRSWIAPASGRVLWEAELRA